ncbi:DUF5672 family protein [Salegentibacter salegens]|uniref:DUF5672 domain-containing protein n=1 Tax=Salegentibacter salegens TaxID=143223 RepID=A0A1M7NXF0_9FLAO|nr:DUF5672 family protein [Salegentibacter salegens]PRX45751.1 hypothetical protein LY58_01748 [Salegentibacter salegens]SHN08310.1 hypothetical protein SAMN05878281_3502 [Salegentibacter salegens]
MKTAVVIPVYKQKMSETEEISFKQCLKVLGDFPIIIVCPKGFNKQSFNNYKLIFEEFEAHYFKDIFGYNSLMLASHFYERFLAYHYILIHQLDVFIFKNELEKWSNQGYDYIGAPWLATDNLTSKILKPFQSKKKKKREPIFYKVGNGGLSLRKTQSFYQISKELEPLIEKQLEKKDKIYAIEDVFWSLRVPEHFPEFSIPDFKIAAEFALDRKPKIGFKINRGELPFGCHGFNKPKVIDFWKPIIKKEFQKK